MRAAAADEPALKLPAAEPSEHKVRMPLPEGWRQQPRLRRRRWLSRSAANLGNVLAWPETVFFQD
jgi:hypothetical protein